MLEILFVIKRELRDLSGLGAKVVGEVVEVEEVGILECSVFLIVVEVNLES